MSKPITHFTMTLLAALILLTAPASDRILAADASPQIRVIVAVPESGIWALDDDQSHLDVILLNLTDQPIKLYDSWNSWGWFNLRLEWEADGKAGTVVHMPRDWTKNFDSTTPLPPGGATIRPVSLSKDWECWPQFKSDMKLTVHAVYESKEAGSGWQGKESSAAVTVIINDRRRK